MGKLRNRVWVESVLSGAIPDVVGTTPMLIKKEFPNTLAMSISSLSKSIKKLKKKKSDKT